MTGRRGWRRRKLLDDLKERRGYSHLKEEALDRTMWTVRFGRGFGPVVRQTTKWIRRYSIPVGTTRGPRDQDPLLRPPIHLMFLIPPNLFLTWAPIRLNPDVFNFLVVVFTFLSKMPKYYLKRVHGHSLPNPSQLTLRWLMSYIYGAPILDVSRSHTTTQHSR